MPSPPNRKLTVVAQDPAISRDGRILTSELEIPNEEVASGPCGYRLRVIDYDPAADRVYPPLQQGSYGTADEPKDPFKHPADRTIRGNSSFHAQNVYAVVMRTLSRFETALGRRVSWAFDAHQLNIAPHGLAGANAFYSRRDNALVFGYFDDPQTNKPIFSCLSHDVVVHETTHAILDGLRQRFMDPSSPDQAAFHEGYADVIALLSGFSMTEVVRAALESTSKSRVIPMEKLTVESVTKSILAGLAEQMGSALSGLRGNPLRRSVQLTPSTGLYKDPRYAEEHNRGELLVAAVMRAFLQVWENRMATLGSKTTDGKPVTGGLDATRVIEEASLIAGRLLKIMIRAIDYTPPVHLRFGDFLCAALTADHELVPDDSAYNFRQCLRESFKSYGIPLSSPGDNSTEPGLWQAPSAEGIDYSQVRFESMKSDVNEVFRFLWENRVTLNLDMVAHTQVLSVRPCRRVGPDGFILHETVAEYLQILHLDADDLEKFGIAPDDAKRAGEVAEADGESEDLTDGGTLRLYGGGTLIFDEYGRLKFHITNRVGNMELQRQRVPYLWESGFYDKKLQARRGIAALHMRRMAAWPLGLNQETSAATKLRKKGKKGKV